MKKSFLLLGAAAMLASTAYGQKDTVKTAVLDEVTITANKLEQKQSSTGKVVTVIGKDQIEKSAGKTVGQLLNEQAGISINGALSNLGTNQSLYTRGAGTGRTLVLMDGIPVNDPSLINNEFDLNLLSLNDVERIEICRGAQSTLYGSDAIAGVINIITTKQDISKPFNVKATATAGNYSTYKGNLKVFGKEKGLTYTARYAKLYSKGFSAANDSSGKGNFGDDKYNGDVANASLQYDINSKLSARTFVQYSRYKTDVDEGKFYDAPDFTSANKSWNTGVGLTYKTEAFSLTGRYQYSDITRNLFNDSTDNPGTLSRNDYYGKTQFIELFANYKLNKNFTLLQGADYRFNSTNQTTFGTYPASQWGPAGTYGSTLDTSLSQASLYASLLFNGMNGKLNIEVGGRLNVHSRYGNNSTYTFNPSYKINEHFRVFGSIASGYKTPSIYQLYSEYGNKGLEPETSTNYEFGIQQQHKKISNRLVYFYRDIKSVLDFDYNTYKYFNTLKQTVRGVEWELKLNPVEKLDITANYTYISPTENTQSRENFKDTSYTYLLRRPKHSINVNIGYNFTPGLYISVGGKYADKRYDQGGYQVPDVQLDAYFIMNAYAQCSFNKYVKVFVDAQNLTNKKFFEIYGYNSIPFVINGGITFSL